MISVSLSEKFCCQNFITSIKVSTFIYFRMLISSNSIPQKSTKILIKKKYQSQILAPQTQFFFVFYFIQIIKQNCFLNFTKAPFSTSLALSSIQRVPFSQVIVPISNIGSPGCKWHYGYIKFWIQLPGKA